MRCCTWDPERVPPPVANAGKSEPKPYFLYFIDFNHPNNFVLNIAAQFYMHCLSSYTSSCWYSSSAFCGRIWVLLVLAQRQKTPMKRDGVHGCVALASGGTCMLKSLHSLGSCASCWYRFHPFYLSFSPGCDLNARECFDGPAAPQQGMLLALIVWWPASFW